MNINEDNFLQLINGGAFRTYNVYLAKRLGSIHSAILLAELVNRYNYHRVNDELVESDDQQWFYYTHEMGDYRLGMSRKEQDTALKNLVDKGLVNKKVFGIPAKRYFSINKKELINFINTTDNSKKDYSLTDSDKLVCQDSHAQFDRKGQTGMTERGKLTYSKETLKKRHNDERELAPQVCDGSSSSFSNQKLNPLDQFQLSKADKQRAYEKLGDEGVVLLAQRLSRWKDRRDDARAMQYCLDHWNNWNDEPTDEEKKQAKEDERRNALDKAAERRKRAEQIKILKESQGKEVDFRVYEYHVEIKQDGRFFPLSFMEDRVDAFLDMQELP